MEVVEEDIGLLKMKLSSVEESPQSGLNAIMAQLAEMKRASLSPPVATTTEGATEAGDSSEASVVSENGRLGVNSCSGAMILEGGIDLGNSPRVLGGDSKIGQGGIASNLAGQRGIGSKFGVGWLESRVRKMETPIFQGEDPDFWMFRTDQ